MNVGTVAYGILLSFVSPFLGFAGMLKSRGLLVKRIIFVTVIVIYGTTIPLTERADGYRHKKMVYDEYIGMSWERFIDDAHRIVTLQLSSSSADLYKHVISFISGSIFNSPGMFFVIVSLIYGIFFSGSMIRIFQDFKVGGKDFVFWVFVLLFLFTKNVEGIQTVRTWTGLWMLFYGVLMFHETREKKYIILLMLPPLIHFGYLLMAIPAYIVVIAGSHPRVFAALFVLSSFFNIINPASVSTRFTQYELGDQKFNQYYQEERVSSEEKLEEFNEKKGDRTWYKKLYVSGYFNWATNLLVYTLLFFGVYPRLMNGIEKHLFSAGLLTLTGSNVFFFVWAASNRMYIIGLVFVLASLAMLMQRENVFRDFMNQNVYFRNMMRFSALLVLPKFIWHISFFLSQLSIYFFFGPFVPWIDEASNISTIDVIKNILL